MVGTLVIVPLVLDWFRAASARRLLGPRLFKEPSEARSLAIGAWLGTYIIGAWLGPAPG